jgi:hypothetical protein
VLNTTSITDNFAVRTCIPADGGSPTISSVMATVVQGSDGKEPHTGFIMEIVPGMTAGTPGDPEECMFVSLNQNMNEAYTANSTHSIIFRPGKKYKGKLDVATLTKSGGHMYIWPIGYTPGSTPGVSFDVWDITQLAIVINLNPSPANPNPTSIGGPTGTKLMWSLGQQNQLQLNSQQENSYSLYFDANFMAQGYK